MLPHLPLDGGEVGTSPVPVPPPPHFRPLVGEPRGVQISSRRVSPAHGSSLAQKAGLRYEAKVHAELLEQFGDRYVQAVPFFFVDNTGRRGCIPDGLLKVSPSRTAIIEIKSQHMPDAWWQLRKLYEPVLRAAGSEREFVLVEICRSFDPATPFPERFDLLDSLLPWAETAADGSFGVMKWKL